MNFLLITFIVSLVLSFIVPRAIAYWHKNYKRPKYSTKLQRPGKFNIFITKVPVLLLSVTIFGTLMGIIMDDTETTIVFLVIHLIFMVIFYFTQRKYDMVYQEKEEYFFLRMWKHEYKVYYDDIINWDVSINAITVLDGSQLEKGYIEVHMGIFRPEILLRKVAEMTFEGEFPRKDERKFDHPLKKTDMVNFLIIGGYGYLIRDYLEEYREGTAGREQF